MTPNHVRPLLSELIGAIERTSRAYHAIVLHAPGAARHPALEGWPELCASVNETAACAQTMLDRFDLDVEPPPFLAGEFAARLRARRSLNPSAPHRPGMRVH